MMRGLKNQANKSLMERKVLSFTVILLALIATAAVSYSIWVLYTGEVNNQNALSGGESFSSRWRPAIGLGVLIVFFTLEVYVPHMRGRRRQITHNARHIGLSLINALPVSAVRAWLTFYVAAVWAEKGWGVLHQLELPGLAELLLVLPVIDGWMYLWHRANHRVPFLWLFHRTHHSDPQMDASTAFRFHTGELVFSSFLQIGLVALLGLSLWHVVLYEVLLLPVILFHHSNVNIPERLDWWLRGIIPTPYMHWVHHSKMKSETHSNYSSLFSWWDRLARTFRLRDDPENIQFGLDGWDDREKQTIWGLLKTPFTGA
jgi:sterol desaturase/sphingolipid hydroxylase (fatty acid hydroxylase superfamily)